MTDPTQSHPLHPSKKAILKASALAFVVAAIVLIFAILPAEYGVDLTGAGKVLGLTRLNTTDAQQENVTAFRAESQTYLQNTVELRLAPRQGFEYKFRMKQGQVLLYSWTADGKLDYEFHGQLENDTTGEFTSYEKMTGNGGNGSLTVPFDGIHGWYWENNTGKPITVKLITSGHYEIKGVVGAPESVIIKSK